jgi:hypothetical protein
LLRLAGGYAQDGSVMLRIHRGIDPRLGAAIGVHLRTGD